MVEGGSRADLVDGLVAEITKLFGVTKRSDDLGESTLSPRLLAGRRRVGVTCVAKVEEIEKVVELAQRAGESGRGG